MKVSATYQSFTMQHHPQVQLLTKYLAERFPVFSFFLMGVTESKERTESLFTHLSATKTWLSHYYLLALANKHLGSSIATIEDQVETSCSGAFNVTVFAVYHEQFKLWLSQQHPFITAVAQRGITLVEAEPLMDTHELQHLNTASVDLSTHYLSGLQFTQEFFEGAKMYRHRNQLPLAAFMLHQSVEHGLRTLLHITTGYRTTTHNLDKLLRYCSMCIHKLSEIFNGSDHAKILFHKLQSAYIHARYKEYSISMEELADAEIMVEAFHQLYKTYGAQIAITENKLQPHTSSL